MSKMNNEEIKRAIDQASEEELEFEFVDASTEKSMRIRDIIDTLDLVDPKTQRIQNIVPIETNLGGESQIETTDYVTLYEPTISGADRKKLIAKLLTLLLEDDV